ncbi:MAG: hypothetical protein HQ594_02915 [Candidatus Omnitrophica bacterium]|nr:hypothetical protein [Candidatus Omnitrophota bacterium]
MYPNNSNFREKMMAIFMRKKVDKIVWQPRLEHWYNVNKARGTLPKKYKDKDLLEIYDDLGASVRYYYGSSEDLSEPNTYLKFSYKRGVKVKEIKKSNDIYIIYETPLGQLRGKKRLGEWGCSCHYTEFPVKSVSDLKILEYMLKNTVAKFDYEFYKEAENKIGNRGVIQFYFERSPLQNCMLFYMGIENTIYALHDFPKRMEEFLKIAEEAQDQMYEVLEKCPVSVLNFGENIDARIDAPSIFREYLLPYYQRKVGQLHKAGKFCHIHMDGAIKPLLPFINETVFDGIEAATPLPQGDVTLEELKEAIGDIILLDGIPAILFLPDYPSEKLEKFAVKVLKLFSPNLILGISDELPPSGDIEKVKFMSQIVEAFKIL